MGVASVARKVFSSSGGVAYYGQITPLSVSRHSLSAATAGQYAVFAGGYSSRAVDAYSSSLVRSSVSDLPQVMAGAAAASAGQYAVFAGGYNGSSVQKTVYAYDGDLALSTWTELSARSQALAGATGTDGAWFGGGSTSTTASDVTNTVGIYSDQGVKTTAKLSVARSDLAAACAGNMVCFGGGCDATGRSSQVDLFDPDRVRTVSALSVARDNPVAVTVGQYAMFAGGRSDTSSATGTVDLLDSDGVRTAAPGIYPIKSGAAAAIGGGYSFIGGGLSPDTSAGTAQATAEVRAVDPETMIFQSFTLASASKNLAAAAVGNYVIFAGGSSSAAEAFSTD